MPRQILEISTGFYQSEILPLSAQRCINWIPVIPQPQGNALHSRALLDVPGITQLATTGSNACRGMIFVGDKGYFVNGSTLYSVTLSGIVTSIGTVSGSGRVSIATNGTLVVIVAPGSAGYQLDTSTDTLTVISDADFLTPSSVTYKDGHFIFSQDSTNNYFVSALNDPLTYDALDIGSTDSTPSNLVGVHTNRNELFLLKEDTIQLAQYVGGSGFPFTEIPGGLIDKGVHAPHSVTSFDNTFCFVGGGVNEKSAIWRYAGGASVQKISTSAIDAEIQKYTRTVINSECFGFSYSLGGNYFVGFTFPQNTFVYDATTSALAGRSVWHERQSGVTDDRWRIAGIMTVKGELVVSDLTDGRIGLINKDVYTEYGNPIFRSKSSAPFSANGHPVYVSELELVMETGTGITSGQGSDPQIRMDYSDDGGKTFSSEFWRSYGKIGEYFKRVIWRRLGRFPVSRIVRFTTTEPVKSNVIRLEATINVGDKK